MMEKCIYCGREPHLVEITGLWYVQCGCAKQNPYEYVGTRKNTAMDAWNAANTITRKAISLRCSHLRKLRSPYIWLVDGTTYHNYRDVLDVVGCSYSTLKSQFSHKKANTVVVKGHIVVRIEREV